MQVLSKYSSSVGLTTCFKHHMEGATDVIEGGEETAGWRGHYSSLAASFLGKVCKMSLFTSPPSPECEWEYGTRMQFCTPGQTSSWLHSLVVPSPSLQLLASLSTSVGVCICFSIRQKLWEQLTDQEPSQREREGRGEGKAICTGRWTAQWDPLGAARETGISFPPSGGLGHHQLLFWRGSKSLSAGTFPLRYVPGDLSMYADRGDDLWGLRFNA